MPELMGGEVDHLAICKRRGVEKGATVDLP